MMSNDPVLSQALLIERSASGHDRRVPGEPGSDTLLAFSGRRLGFVLLFLPDAIFATKVTVHVTFLSTVQASEDR